MSGLPLHLLHKIVFNLNFLGDKVNWENTTLITKHDSVRFSIWINLEVKVHANLLIEHLNLIKINPFNLYKLITQCCISFYILKNVELIWKVFLHYQHLTADYRYEFFVHWLLNGKDLCYLPGITALQFDRNFNFLDPWKSVWVISFDVFTAGNYKNFEWF